MRGTSLSAQKSVARENVVWKHDKTLWKSEQTKSLAWKLPSRTDTPETRYLLHSFTVWNLEILCHRTSKNLELKLYKNNVVPFMWDKKSNLSQEALSQNGSERGNWNESKDRRPPRQYVPHLGQGNWSHHFCTPSNYMLLINQRFGNGGYRRHIPPATVFR